MIVRKPYAFLIKYFKLIHIILFIMCGFLLFKLRIIYLFFKNFVKTDVYLHTESIAKSYISPLMLIVSLIIPLLGIAIFYLMRNKDKPVFFYRVLIIYGFGLFVSLIAFYIFYNSLDYQTYDKVTLSIYRDISGIFYYLTYLFIALSFIRGFGFDIRKFNFSKDMHDLNLNETDNEEVELSIDIDKDKILNSLRRERRYTWYYLKENRVSLIIILVLSLLIGGYFVYQNVYLKNIIYKQGEVVTANKLEYYVNHTYITNYDKKNQILANNYVIIAFSVTNKSDTSATINLVKTRLVIDNNYFYPELNHYESFNDLFKGYNNEILIGNVTKNYMLVFKIESIEDNSKIILELYDGENNDEIANYKRLLLNKEFFSEKKLGTYYLMDTISFKDSLIGDKSIVVKDYEISNKFIYNYKVCQNDNCSDYKKIVVSEQNKTVLKINYDGFNINNSLFDNYLSLSYNYLDKTYDINENSLKILYVSDDALFIEVPSTIKDAFNITLKFNIRGLSYNLKLEDRV